MSIEFKKLHIGELIHSKVKELKISNSRITNFFHCTTNEVEIMYQSQNIDVESLLKWSKLLEYDFFRIYTQHLILYSPPKGNNSAISSSLPSFRKNIYTKEIIEFFLDLIYTGKKTKAQIIEEYNIPKTTLYKWLVKYPNNINL